MDQNNSDFEQEHSSLKEVDEFQKNMYNPGHYVGTGKVPPTISGTGNTLPGAIVGFLGAGICVLFSLLFLFSKDGLLAEGLSGSDAKDKIMVLSILLVSAVGSFRFGWVYWKKSKKYRQEKIALKNEPLDTAVEDKIWQRTCPKCGKTHDMDYPKCPHCKFDYLE